MSCEDIPSLLDLQKVKKHADDFGRLMGTGIGTSTNGVTGQVRPTFNKVINDMRVDFNQHISDQESEFNQHISGMAFTRVGTFKSGATLDDLREVLLWDVSDGGDGHEYGWTGPFQKVVTPNSTPSSTGGIGSGAWVDRSDVTLRSALVAPGGAGLVGGLAKPVTWVGFAGGADPTGVNDSTAAFLAANATQRKIYVPRGSYKLTKDVVSDPLTSWELEMGVNIPGPFRLRQTPWIAGPNEQIFHYLERMSRNTFIGPTDGIGVFGTAHNDGAGYAGAAIGVAGLGYNDNTVGPGGGAWALYGTAVRNAGTTGPTHGMELDIANRGNELELYPFDMFSSGQTHGIWLGSGGELGGVGENGGVPLNSASVAIGIVSNDGNPTKTARFLKGIVFQSDSLKGTDGVTGEGIAIALANRHTMQWYGASNQRLGAVTCQGTDASKALRINLSDNGVLFQKNTGGQTQFSIEAIPGTPANFPVVRAATAGNPVQLAASGSDANIGLLLKPKGAGTVDVDSIIAPVVANTYSVGTSLRPWAGGFTQTAFTVTSDERAKTKPEAFPDAMLDAAAEVDWCMFQYLERIEAKGADGARWHFGAIAQRFVEAFERHGLDPYRFGFICYNEWEDQYVKVQANEGETVTKTRTVSQPVMVTMTREVLVDEVLEDGTKIKKATMEEYQTPKLIQVYIFNEDGSPHLDDNGVRAFVMEPVMEDIIEEYTEPAPPEYVDVLEVPAGSRYGIRYDQAIILKQKQIERDQQHEIDTLMKRIKDLEVK